MRLEASAVFYRLNASVVGLHRPGAYRKLVSQVCCCFSKGSGKAITADPAVRCLAIQMRTRRLRNRPCLHKLSQKSNLKLVC